ncbi:MAG: phosphoribosylanthranilate isomerase [Candidatus Thorarchaeota archaeon]|nr:phosphoribosylanthranilate isomerase [Candidatus Thorarchaeota archaeon]
MCEEEGIDSLGFVLFSGLARSMEPAEVREIGSRLGPMITRTAILPYDDIETACDLALRSEVDAVQIHGCRPEHFDVLRGHGLKTICSVSVNSGTGVADVGCDELRELSSSCDCILFEPLVDGRCGGMGIRFDYECLRQRYVSCCRRFGVAGGLTPSNVHHALALRPYSVNVSSGVEYSVGLKNRELVRDFVRQCKNSQPRKEDAMR